MNVIKKISPLLLILGLSYWAIAPFFIQGFFPIHDDTQVARVFEMHKSLSDGMFPVRWVADLGYGYGYPIFNFYAPLAYYVGGAIALFGFDALIATKAMMALGILLAGVSMYLFAKQFWGELGAIVSALLYVYAPYHAVEVYVRGDVSEFWAYAFIPLAFLGIYKVYLLFSSQAKSKNLLVWFWITIASLGYAGIILSHNLTAMMVTPFLFSFSLLLYIIVHKKVGKLRSLFILLPIVLGVLLSTFYWLPTLKEMNYTNVLSVVGGGSDYKDHFVCPMQLWNSPWGFAGSAPGCVDGISFKIGKLHIILTLLSFVTFWFIRKLKKIDLKIVLFFVTSLALSLFLMLDASSFIWDAIPKMAFFQFPWRFLILVSFFTSFLSGAVLMILNKKKMPHYFYWIVAGITIFIVIFFNAKMFNPRTISNVTVDNYTSTQALNWVASKISDEYMPQKFDKPKKTTEVPDKKIILNNPSATIISMQSNTQKIEAKIDTKEKLTAIVNIAYFPAWHIYVDNNPAQYEIFTKGIKVVIPEGRHDLKAVFIQTPIEKIANYLSLAGVFILILGIITQRRSVKNDKKST